MLKDLAAVLQAFAVAGAILLALLSSGEKHVKELISVLIEEQSTQQPNSFEAEVRRFKFGNSSHQLK